MYDSKVMFLIGAGASIPVGIDGMGAMAEAFQKSLTRNSKLLRGYDLLVELTGSHDLEELLQVANGIAELPGGPSVRLIEHCIAPRGSKQRLKSIRTRLHDQVESVQEVRRALLSWITKSCLEFDRDKATKMYSQLVRLVSERGYPVFTTNYDAVFDVVAEREGIDVTDNFTEKRFGRRFWDPSLQSFQGKGLRLIHIHGSIQWHQAPDGSVEKIPQPAEHNREGKPLERLLIFPTRFKDIYSQSYFPLYSLFTRTLGRAEVLYVVGHSLRDEYLLAAIRDRLRDADFRLVVFDPVFDARPKLENLGSSASDRIIHIRRSIEDVHPLLLQAVSTGDASAVDTIRAAARNLSRGKKDKIQLGAWPTKGVAAGDAVDFLVTVDTTCADGVVEVAVEDYPEPGQQSLIPISVEGQRDHWQVTGFLRETRNVRFTVPTDIGIGPRKLTVRLGGSNPDVMQVRMLKVRAPKAD